MKKLLLIPIVFFGLTISQAQTTFQKTYGGTAWDIGRSVRQTTDGGYIFTGECLSSNTGIYVCKTDSIGDTTWTKTFGNPSYKQWDHATSVVQTNDGGYAITGGAWSFGGASNIGDIFLLKLDGSGNQQWVKIYANSGMDAGQAVIQTSDNGFVIAGAGSSSSPNANIDFFILKIDQNGDTLWTKTYYGLGTLNGESVIENNDGSLVVSGYIATPLDTTGFFGDTTGLFIVKTDVSGITQWVKIFSDFKVGGWPPKNAICKTNDSGYVVVGDILDTSLLTDTKTYLLKLNANGDTVWSSTFNLQGGGNQARAVLETNDGGLVFTGVSYDTSWNMSLHLTKTNSIGIVQWVKYFQDADGQEVHQTNDNGFIVVGAKYQTSWDLYLIKTDSTGYVIMTGENDFILIKGEIKIFPNPFSTQTTLQTDNPLHNATLTVYNCFGQQVKQFVIRNSSSFVIRRDNLPSGLYFIRLTQDNKIITTDKLVITDNF